MSASSRRYDRVSTAYGVVADAAEHGARDSGLRLLDARPGERILEIGCGTGRALPRIAASVQAGGLACGLDTSPGMLGLAREHTSAPAVALLRADARCLPCREGRFDGVFMSFTLELFDSGEMGLVLAEVRRVLKPGGRLVLVALNAEDTFPVDAYRWLHRHFPEWIDCRPIEVLEVLAGNRYTTLRTCRVEIWKLPVVIAVARPDAA